MIRAAALAPVLLVGSMLLGPVPVTAQDPWVSPEVMERLETRVEELSGRHQAAEAIVEARESRERAEQALRFRVDSAFVGPIRIVALDEDMAQATARVAKAWSAFKPLVGEWRPDSPRQMTLIFATRGGPGDPVWRLSGGYGFQTRLERWTDTRGAISGLTGGERELSKLLNQALPNELNQWADDFALDPEFPWPYAARAALRTSSQVLADCLEGDDAVCLELLDLPRLVDLTDPAVRRAKADRLLLLHGEEGLRSLAQDGRLRGASCDADIPMDDCLESLLRVLPSSPTSPAVRAAFLRTALEMGGPGSLGRALDAGSQADSGLVPLLESIASAPVDEILDRWRSRIAGASADRRQRTGGALFWTAAFGLMALTSSRWRF